MARSGQTPEPADRTSELRDALAATTQRIADDRTLSDEQERTAITAEAVTFRTEVRQSLGPDASDAYQHAARAWIESVALGRVVTFGENNYCVRVIGQPLRPPEPARS